jgi:hypothetical protein
VEPRATGSSCSHSSFHQPDALPSGSRNAASPSAAPPARPGRRVARSNGARLPYGPRRLPRGPRRSDAAVARAPGRGLGARLLLPPRRLGPRRRRGRLPLLAPRRATLPPLPLRGQLLRRVPARRGRALPRRPCRRGQGQAPLRRLRARPARMGRRGRAVGHRRRRGVAATREAQLQAHGRHRRVPRDDRSLLQELPGAAPRLLRGIQHCRARRHCRRLQVRGRILLEI